MEYLILPKYRKKGYAHEALRGLINAAFGGKLIEECETIKENVLSVERANIDMILLKTKHTNQASIRIAEKLGFSYDGKIKKGILCPSREIYFDELIYSLEN